MKKDKDIKEKKDNRQMTFSKYTYPQMRLINYV